MYKELKMHSCIDLGIDIYLFDISMFGPTENTYVLKNERTRNVAGL